MVNGSTLYDLNTALDGLSNPVAAGTSTSLSRYVSSGANVSNLDRNFYVALSGLIQAAASAGHSVTINDGWRDHDVQRRAYDNWRATGENLAGDEVPAIAPAGRSRHEIGLAADIAGGSPEATAWLHENAERYGIQFTLSSEPWHAVFAGQQAKTTITGDPVPGWATYGGTNPYNADIDAGSAQTRSEAGLAEEEQGAGPAEDTFSGTIPSDLVILNVPGVGQFVGYEIAPGVWGYWDGAGIDRVNNAQVYTVDSATWEGLSSVRLGDIGELDELEAGYGTFKEFITEQAYRAGIAQGALTDEVVARVFLETIADPALLLPENAALLAGKLQESEWFKTRTTRQRQWNDGSLSPADKQQFIEEEISNLKAEVYRYLGANVPFNDPRLREWAEKIASGATSISTIINSEIKPMAEGLPDSPWSRTLRDEDRAQLQRGVDYEDEAARIRAKANRWGVTMSEDDLLEWGRKVTENIMSQDDITEYLKDQAQALYPWKARELETAAAAAPYIQAFNSTFEVSGTDLFSDEIQQAMQSGKTVTDFAQELRNTDRWLTTENGRDSVLSIGSQVARTMGFQ